MYAFYTLFIHSSTDGHSVWFYILATLIDVGGGCLWEFCLNLFSCILRSQNARSYSSSFWVILGGLLYYFPFQLHQLHSPSEQVFPFLHVLVHTCYFSSSCEHPLTSHCVSLSVSFIYPLEICIFPLDPQWLPAHLNEHVRMCVCACLCVRMCDIEDWTADLKHAI